MEDVEIIEETNIAKFYKNKMSRSIANHAESKDLKGFDCVVAESRDGKSKDFILYFVGTPILASQKAEDLWARIDAHYISNKTK